MTAPNLLFPGRPDYIGPHAGVFGFVHHEILCEHSHNIMERLEHIDRNKPAHEIAIRRHNMIYLGGCEAAAKRAPLVADYAAKCAPLDAEILAYIRRHIPDCAWNGKTLVFTRVPA